MRAKFCESLADGLRVTQFLALPTRSPAPRLAKTVSPRTGVYFGASSAMWSDIIEPCFIICFFILGFFIGAIWSEDMWSAVIPSAFGASSATAKFAKPTAHTAKQAAAVMRMLGLESWKAVSWMRARQSWVAS